MMERVPVGMAWLTHEVQRGTEPVAAGFKRKGIDLSTVPDSRVTELFNVLLTFVTPTGPSD
jgi:hypothetical protein